MLNYIKLQYQVNLYYKCHLQKFSHQHISRAINSEQRLRSFHSKSTSFKIKFGQITHRHKSNCHLHKSNCSFKHLTNHVKSMNHSICINLNQLKHWHCNVSATYPLLCTCKFDNNIRTNASWKLYTGKIPHCSKAHRPQMLTWLTCPRRWDSLRIISSN